MGEQDEASVDVMFEIYLHRTEGKKPVHETTTEKHKLAQYWAGYKLPKVRGRSFRSQIVTVTDTYAEILRHSLVDWRKRKSRQP